MQTYFTGIFRTAILWDIQRLCQTFISVFFLFFCRSICSLPDFAQLFLQNLLTTLKRRNNQQEVILLQLETVLCRLIDWLYYRSAKTVRKTHGFLLIQCLFNAIMLQLEISFYCEKSLCNRFYDVMTQANKKRKNRYHIFFYRLWF